jgi:class 3 adenylate cyclase/tetratricopeptide (TPR) repeat protein
MNLLDIVSEVRRHLEQNRRLSLRMLRRQYELDDDAIAEVVEELVDVQRVAMREGNALAWAGGLESEQVFSPPARDLRSYTPKHLATRILQSRSAIEGERKQVTVMFADVKGSLELAEQVDPEDWHRILEGFFGILTEGVHRFEGTVNQYTGDGIMALFGAPIAHEDHAQRACYAALHLRDALRDFTREFKRAHGLDFGVRIGLNSGDVVVGKIGDDLRMDYTAQGHTVGMAQRMETLASAGSVYLSRDTASLAGDYFDLDDLGEFTVKGGSEPLQVFELTGAGAARTRFDVSRDRGLASFVGRSDEIALLEAALEQALAGPGRTIGVVAQAGTGKSRLCYEFIESCRRRGLSVYEARGLSHGAQIPLLPVRELMREFFGIDERDSDRVAREKIAGRTLLLDESLADDLPIFFDLLGVPDPTRPLPEGDPDLLQRRMYAALRAIVRADSEVDPGVLLVEDLHWLDPASDAVLTQIIEANADSRSLVLVNFRPEYRAHWMQQSQYQQLPLLPLSEDALRALLIDLLGQDPSVAKLPEAIHARTAGNPFFIEEVVQSLIEDGALEGTRGSYRLVTRVDRLRMPDNVQALLAARIDRLGEREKHVLQSASVIGKDFPERILKRVVELPDDDLAAALRTLQGGEFVYEAALYPDHVYAFKHPLTQEVAERSQLARRREQRHAAVATAYQELDPEHLDERAALLAHHWEHAAEPTRAAHWHARAAGRMGSIDYRESVAHWRRVDELVQLESNAESEALQTRAFIELTLGSFRVGAPERDADELFARGRSFLTERGDQANLARLTSAYSTLIQNRGHMVQYLELATQSMEAARRVGDPGVLAYCGLDQIYALIQHGALAEAVAVADEIVELANGDVELGADVGYSPLILCPAFTAGPLAHMGRFEEAQERLDAAVRLAADRAGDETLVWLGYQEVELAQTKGDHEAALRAAERCRARSERSGSTFDVVAAQLWVAMAHAGLEAWEACLAGMQEGAAASEKSGLGGDVLIATGWVHARALLGLGMLDEASEQVDQAIEVCREQQTRLNHGRCLIVRAAIHRACGRDAEAEADLDAAQRLVEETGARFFQAPILEGRGQLREALSLYQEFGATGHAERVRRMIGE